MSPVDLLWKAICRDPRDLALRHALAEFHLREGDRELGEFINLCMLTNEEIKRFNQEDEAAGTPLRRLKERDARAEALFKAHGVRWFPPDPHSYKWDWRYFAQRGVPDRLDLSKRDPIEHLDWWLDRYPVRALSLSGELSNRVARLVERERFAAIEELSFEEVTFTIDAIEALRRAPPGPLTIGLHQPIGLDGAAWARLLAAPMFSKARLLGISAAALEPEAIEAIWSMTELQELTLYECSLRSGSLAALPQGTLALQALHIAKGLDEVDLEKMLRSLDMRRLEELELHQMYLKDGAVQVLAERLANGALEQLRALDLSFNSIDDDHAELLAERVPAALRRLKLCANILGERAMAQLAQSDAARQLEVLGVSGNSVYDGTQLYYTWDPNEPAGSTQVRMELPKLREKFGFPDSLALV